MVNYTWTGATDTSSINVTNWSPNGLPGPNDVVIFDSNGTRDCSWQHPATSPSITVDEMIIESDFAHDLQLNAVPVIKGMSLNKNIIDGTAGQIEFRSGPIASGGYKTYNSKYLLIGDSATYSNGRQNLTFDFYATNTCAFDDGQHPNIRLASGDFTPKYTTPTGTSGVVDFYSLAIVSSVSSFAPDSSIVANDKSKHFKMASGTTSQFSCSIAVINWGSSTVEFTGVSSGTFNLPVSLTTDYNSGTFEAYYRKMILSANSAGDRIDMQDNRYLSVEEFEIGDGLLFVGPRTLNAQGSDVRTILPPKIRGSWSFSSISDGIYRSPRQASGPMPKIAGNFDITGKLTVGGLIDPTGMVFTPQATNPESTNPQDTIWIDSETNHLFRGERDTESTVHFNVRNDEGATIPVGAPLYSKGEIGGSNRIKVGIADASDPNKMPAIGLAMEEMNTTSTKDGNMILTGILNESVTITGVAEQDIIYVAPHGGTAPYLTITRPTSSSHLVQNVGVCVRQASANVSQGMKVAAIGRTNDSPNCSFLMVNTESTHPQSRRLVAGTNITITDGGAGGDLTIASSGGGAESDPIATPLANANTASINNINTKSHMWVTKSSTQSYTPAATPAVIQYDTVQYDTGSDWDSANYAFEAPRTGYYLVDVGFYLAATPTWSFSMVYKSTDGGSSWNYIMRNVSGSGQQNKLVNVVKLNAGDLIAHYANSSNTGTINVSVTSLTYFRVAEMIG